MVSECSLEIDGLQERVETKETELARLEEKLGDLSLSHERFKAAQKEADKNLREMTTFHERTLKERDEFDSAIGKKEAILQWR